MSLKEQCFEYCNTIQKMQIRHEIKNLIGNLNSGPDRGSIGYHSRQQHKQFYAYLAINLNRLQIEASFPIKLTPLEQSEIELLGAGHSLLWHLDQLFLNEILALHPNLRMSIVAYSSIEITSRPEEITNLLENEITSSLVTLFKNSPAYTYLSNVPNEIIGSIDQNGMKKIIANLLRQIGKKGVHEVPEELRASALATLRSATYTREKAIFAIISLREMISNINQTLYQAFISEKPPIFDESNLANIIENNSNVLGGGITVFAQINEKLFLPEVADVALIKCQLQNYKLDLLGMIESMELKFGGDFGMTLRASVRILDENFNPFHNLIK